MLKFYPYRDNAFSGYGQRYGFSCYVDINGFHIFCLAGFYRSSLTDAVHRDLYAQCAVRLVQEDKGYFVACLVDVCGGIDVLASRSHGDTGCVRCILCVVSQDVSVLGDFTLGYR